MLKLGGEVLGREATLRCLQQVSMPVMLVATEDGAKLYETLGFETVDWVQNLVAPQGVRLPVENHQTIQESDFPKIAGFDRSAFGADRSRLLKIRWKQATGGALLPGRDLFDWPKGFGWKVAQGERLNLGPVIAPDTQGALQLVGNLAAGHTGLVRIDAPARHADFIDALVDAGFKREFSRAVMLKGATKLPGQRDRIYGLAALAFG